MAPAMSIDRLSSLPESLATAILSRLPLKDAVRTGVLSRRWQHSWRSIPNIVVHTSDFRSIGACIDFLLHRVVTFPRGVSVDLLSLCLPPPEPRLPLLSSVLRFALSRGVKSLDLDFAGPDRAAAPALYILPNFVYDYGALHALTLIACDFTLSNFANLSLLKTAAFGCVQFPNAALRTLLTGCPLLESLVLFKCVETTEFAYSVNSTKLTTLQVVHCVGMAKLTVDAPNLRRFQYVGGNIMFVMANLGVLEHADFNLSRTPIPTHRIDDSVQQLVMNFHNARVLRVCRYITTVLGLSGTPDRLPRCLEAKLLMIESALSYNELDGILCLLSSSPYLQKIQFNIPPPRDFEIDDIETYIVTDELTPVWEEDLPAPHCVRHTLMEVEMNGARGLEPELQWLKYLIEFGSALRMVRVRLMRWADGSGRPELYQDLSRILNQWRYEYSGPQLEIDIQI